MKIFPLFALAFSTVLTGCGSIHPVQQDVTKLPTVRIVDQIRCEASIGIYNKALYLLEHENILNKNLIYQFVKDPGSVASGKYNKLFRPEELKVFNEYIETAIAFEFSFDITELENASFTLDPIGLILKGTVKIALSGSDNRMRQNTRGFIVADTFKALLKLYNTPQVSLASQSCKDIHVAPDYNYPISGSIGLSELIDTFIDLNQDTTLLDAEGPALKSKSPVFVDTLKFTTALSGTATPGVTLNPVGHGVRIMDGSLGGTVTRTDIHQVIIGLSLNPVQKAAANKARTIGIGITGAQPLTSVLAKSVQTPAEEVAIQAITQQRYNSFLDRFGTLPIQ